MAVLIAELYGQVFGSPRTGLVRHTIYWLYPSWNHITILGSNVMLYTWYMKQLHLKKCLDKRGKSQQTECPLSLLRFNGLCSNPSRLWNNHKGLRCQRRNWRSSYLHGLYHLPALQFTSCTRQSPPLTGAHRHSGVFTPALTSTDE